MKKVVTLLFSLSIILVGCSFNPLMNSENEKKSTEKNNIQCVKENGETIFVSYDGTCKEYFDEETQKRILESKEYRIYIDGDFDSKKCIYTLGIQKNDKTEGYKIVSFIGKLENNNQSLNCDFKYPVLSGKSSDGFNGVEYGFYYYNDVNKCDLYYKNVNYKASGPKDCSKLAKKLFSD